MSINVQLEQATFAGGCFWCIQGPFDYETGVTDVQVGFAGGSQADADYDKVASGQTKHREAAHMEFDPAIVSYRTLVEIFFRQIDPTDPGGQFNDRGHHYTTAIYYHTPEQQQIAAAYITELNASGKFDKPIVTAVEPFTTFFAADKDHQQYYKKNPLRYGLYKKGSGREDFIHNTWNNS